MPMSEIITRIIYYFLASYVMSIYFIYSWNVLSGKNYNRKISKFLSLNNQKKYIVLSIIITIINIITTDYSYLKLPLMMIVLTLYNYTNYSKNLKISIIMLFLTQFIVIICESILVIIFVIFTKNDIESLLQINNVYILFSLATTILSILLFKTKLPVKIYDLIVKVTYYDKNQETTLYTITLLAIAIISTTASYLRWHTIYILLINTILFLFFVFISLQLVREKNKFEETNKKYRTSINGLREYEEMMDKYRVVNHENKNTLLEIRGMLAHEDSKDKIIKMIDNTIDNKIKDNEKIMHKTVKIPEGGLRGIIYSKICVMDDLKIKYKLDIANDVRTVDLINLDDDVIVNICKILGVFIDNSIEEVRNLKKKNIGIEIYVIDDTLSIDISNNYKGDIDMDKIDNAGYTTKGKGHGYGLALVNKILEENKDILENERMIDKNIFTQCLKIKLKQE